MQRYKQRSIWDDKRSVQTNKDVRAVSLWFLYFSEDRLMASLYDYRLSGEYVDDIQVTAALERD